MGQRHCGPCRDYRLYELQHPGGPGAVFGGTGTVDLGRWIGAGGKIIGEVPGGTDAETIGLLMAGNAPDKESA